MCATTRSGQLVAECPSVERCLYVNLLRRLRRVLGVAGDEAKAWEDIVPLCYRLMLSNVWCDSLRTSRFPTPDPKPHFQGCSHFQLSVEVPGTTSGVYFGGLRVYA